MAATPQTLSHRPGMSLSPPPSSTPTASAKGKGRAGPERPAAQLSGNDLLGPLLSGKASTSSSRPGSSQKRTLNVTGSGASGRNSAASTRSGSRTSGSRPQSPQSGSAPPSRARPASPPHFPPAPTIARPSHNEQKDISSTLAKKRNLRYLLRRKPSSQDSDVESDAGDFIGALKREAAEACKQLQSQHVELVINGRTVHSEVELGDMDVPNPSYVWETMYENQRGMSLFGKSWYSSNSLLPSDPTTFTLPKQVLTTELARSNAPGGPRRWEAQKAKIKQLRSSINTGYTLESYQTPSPAWVWLTPWMVSMRPGTDEQGWEYNLWFHKTSWRSHPGHFNWWGWVRRRKWVRLRGLEPEIIERANDELREAAEHFWGRHGSHHSSHHSSADPTPGMSGTRSSGTRSSGTRSPGDGGEGDRNDDADSREDLVPEEDGPVSIGYTLRRSDGPDDSSRGGVDDGVETACEVDRASTTTDGGSSCRGEMIDNPRDVDLALLLGMAHPVRAMVRILVLAPLDREKQAALNGWIDEASKEDVEELKQLLEDSQSLALLSRAFVFQASRETMYQELLRRGIVSTSSECIACLTMLQGPGTASEPAPEGYTVA